MEYEGVHGQQFDMGRVSVEKMEWFRYQQHKFEFEMTN